MQDTVNGTPCRLFTYIEMEYTRSVSSFKSCSLRTNINSVRNLTAIKTDLIYVHERFVLTDKLRMFDFTDEKYNHLSEDMLYWQV